MPRDPYQDPPSREELAASGADQWLADSLAKQQQQQRELKRSLAEDSQAWKSEQRSLEQLLELPPDLDPEDPVLDLFAAEREAARRDIAPLRSLKGELAAKQAQEKEQLRQFFDL